MVVGAIVTGSAERLWGLHSTTGIPVGFAGISFEQAHRAMAELVGLLTITLAAWISRVDRRPWMRKLGWTTLCTLILQGIFGGILAVGFLPPSTSVVHATLAQTFFCLVVAIWVFTGRKCVQEPRQDLPSHRPSIQTLTALTVSAIYLQLILGAAFRHHSIQLLPHILSAIVVTFVVLWTVVRVLTEFPQVDQLRRPAIAMLSLLMVQLGLGFASWVTRFEIGAGASISPAAALSVSVAHIAVGMLLLATAVVMAIHAWRHVAIPTPQRIPRHEPRAVAV